MASPPVSEGIPSEPSAQAEQASTTEPVAAVEEETRPTTPPNNNNESDPIPKETPRKHKLTNSALYALNAGTWSAMTIKQMLFRECISSFVGFVPVNQFLESFLPWQRDAIESQGGIFPAYTGGAETTMYGPFVNAANQIGLKTLHFVDIHDSPDINSFFERIKPDVAVYKKGGRMSGLDFGDLDLWMEFKTKLDPFKDVSGEDLSAIAKKEGAKDDTEKEKAVGQIISYAVSHMGSGYFTHSFSVSIFGNFARLIRWDRAGAIVSQEFDYVKGNQLVEFFLRFDQLPSELRGRDSTITKPSAADRKEAKKSLLQKRKPEESDEDYFDRKEFFNADAFVEYHVHDSNSSETRRFVGPPLARPVLSLHGRSTRGVPVYDVKTGAVCFLKDTWRINSDKQLPEGKTYELLHEAKVNHIANVVVHGDVLASIDTPCSVAADNQPMSNYQTTYSDLFSQSKEKWCELKSRLQGYIHYRIVLDMVGREYTTFKSTKELLSVTVDAIKAHGEAYEKAGILHRDISPGNIMITEDGRGFLIDWDFAKSIHGEGARSLGRTGTWQFISAFLLEQPETKIHEYSDDLESFLHVLTHTLIRFTKTNYSANYIRYFLHMLFDDTSALFEPEFPTIEERMTMKAHTLRGRTYIPKKLSFTGRSNLSKGLARISTIFAGLYQVTDTEADMKQWHEIHAHLNKYTDGGGDEFIDKITETVDTADESWQDGPAELIPLPSLTPMSSRSGLEEHVRASIPRVPFHTSQALGDRCGKLPWDNVEDMRVKRQKACDSEEQGRA